MKMIRVVLAEDQSMVLGALAALLRLETDIEITGCATNGEEALQCVRLQRPDILVTDIEMPSLSGLDLARQIRADKLDTRVVILTTFGRSGYLRRALDTGVLGYLLKDAPSEQLAAAIRAAVAGRRSISPELALSGWDDVSPLTDRERQVLQLAAEGISSSDIAKKVFLSEGTVRNYLSEAISKLGAANRVEAARIAREKGWL